MNDDDLTTFCAETLPGQRVGPWTTYWDFPGCVNLCPDDAITNETDEDVYFVATPDFVNGEPSNIVFAVGYFGYVISLDEETVEWRAETALETWRAAVEKRMPLVEEVFAILRAEGDEETKCRAAQALVDHSLRTGKFWEMHDKLFENQKALYEKVIANGKTKV